MGYQQFNTVYRRFIILLMFVFLTVSLQAAQNPKGSAAVSFIDSASPKSTSPQSARVKQTNQSVHAAMDLIHAVDSAHAVEFVQPNRFGESNRSQQPNRSEQSTQSPQPEQPTQSQKSPPSNPSNNSFLEVLKQGKFSSNTRFFSMLTDNAKGYTDYYANALGTGLGYESGIFRPKKSSSAQTKSLSEWSFKVAAYAIMDIGSSDFTKLDSLSNQPNRYEIGLFDVANPGLSGMLVRLEELQLKYSYGKSPSEKLTAILGNQLLKTPFINPQDGRMRPTMAQGLVIDKKYVKGLQIQFGLINKISPRSTMKWYDVGNSMGLYAAGQNPNGSKSGYVSNLPKTAIMYAGATQKLPNLLSSELQVWIQAVPKIFQTYLLQWDRNPQQGWAFGVQSIFQHALKNGGNVDPLKTYFPENNKSLVLGARIGYVLSNKQRILINATRITAKGRYLMPREWGRDPFYTFMPRERNEGYGDVWAVTCNYSIPFKAIPLTINIGMGKFTLPPPNQPALNKYAFPSYYQGNLDLKYAFKGTLKGLNAQLLVVEKLADTKTALLPKYEINKVNLLHVNFVLEYQF